MSEKLITRAERLSFLDCGTSSAAEFKRMTGFTAITSGKNAKEYSRQYVDMATESSDVVGYAAAVEYSFDRHVGNPVHEKIAAVSDDELLGSESHVDIVTVDLFTEGDSKVARKRTYSIVPDTDGDGTDALIYSGNFKAVSEIVKGTATSADSWKTCTFVEPAEPSE